MATKITLTALQLAAFLGARSQSTSIAKTTRKNLWADLRRQWGIPTSVKLKVELNNVGAPNYLALADKATGRLLMSNNGRYVGLDTPAAAPTAAAPAAPTADTAAPDGYVTVLTTPTVPQVRYAVVKASALAGAADNDNNLYTGDDIEDDDIVVETRADAGRIVYDPSRDALMVRIND